MAHFIQIAGSRPNVSCDSSKGAQSVTDRCIFGRATPQALSYGELDVQLAQVTKPPRAMTPRKAA
jgi:hypothetical protein